MSDFPTAKTLDNILVKNVDISHNYKLGATRLVHDVLRASEDVPLSPATLCDHFAANYRRRVARSVSNNRITDSSAISSRDWEMRSELSDAIRIISIIHPDIFFTVQFYRLCNLSFHLDPPLADPLRLVRALGVGAETLATVDLTDYPKPICALRDWLLGKICLRSLVVPASYNQRLLVDTLHDFAALLQLSASVHLGMPVLDAGFIVTLDNYSLRYTLAGDRDSPYTIWFDPAAHGAAFVKD